MYSKNSVSYFAPTAPRSFASRMVTSQATQGNQGTQGPIAYVLDENLVTNKQASVIDQEVSNMTRALRSAGVTDPEQLRKAIQNYVDEKTAQYQALEEKTPSVSTTGAQYDLPDGIDVHDIPNNVMGEIDQEWDSKRRELIKAGILDKHEPHRLCEENMQDYIREIMKVKGPKRRNRSLPATLQRSTAMGTQQDDNMAHFSKDDPDDEE